MEGGTPWQQLYKPGFDTAGVPWGSVSNAAEDGGGALGDVEGLVRMLQWRDDEGSSCLHLWVVSPSFTSNRYPPAYPFAALDHLLSNYTTLADHDPRLRAALRAALEDCDIMGLTPLHLAGITAPSCLTKLAVAFHGSRRLWLLEQVARAVGADPAPVSYLWHCTPGDLRWVFHGTEDSATAGSDENDAELARMRVERVRVWDRQRGAEEWLDVGELVQRCGMRAYVPFYLGFSDYSRYVLTQILGEDTPQAKKHRLLYAKVIVVCRVCCVCVSCLMVVDSLEWLRRRMRRGGTRNRTWCCAGSRRSMATACLRAVPTTSTNSSPSTLVPANIYYIIIIIIYYYFIRNIYLTNESL